MIAVRNIGFPASRRAEKKRRRREIKVEMKRSKALEEIKGAGWHGDSQKASLIVALNGIGSAAARKAYMDGQKSKERGESCGCAECAKKGAKA